MCCAIDCTKVVAPDNAIPQRFPNETGSSIPQVEDCSRYLSPAHFDAVPKVIDRGVRTSLVCVCELVD